MIHFSDDKDQKLRILFNLLDDDNDGLIGIEELERGFLLVKVAHIDSKDLREIATQTLMYADKERRGVINFEEFQKFFDSVLQITI